MMRVFFVALISVAFLWAPLFLCFGIFSLIIGAFGAYAQKKSFKIFFAFTSMNVIGFTLILISFLNYRALILAHLFFF